MKLITRLRSMFGTPRRAEIVIPDGPRLTPAQTRAHHLQKLAELRIDRDRLAIVYERSMGIVPVRFKSEYYRHEWSVYAPGQAELHIQNNAEVAYDHLKELNELDPHPDFDRMHTDPRRPHRTLVA